MLKGTYYFREIYYFLDPNSGNVAESAVAYNTITFDGNGNYTGSATIVDSSQGAGTSAIKGTYSIAASGYGFIADPLISGDTIYGLVSQQGIFVGSSSEAQYNNLFIAAPYSTNTNNGTLKGSYQIASLDVTAALQYYYYYGQGDPYILGSTFQFNPDGAGNLGSFVISGYYGGSGSSLYSQTVTGVKYAFSNGAASFTIPNSNNALTSGQKYLYISPDGNFVFGGGNNAWDFFVGVRTGSGTPNLNGFYYQAGVDEDGSGVNTNGYAFLDSYFGSIYASNGVIWGHQRIDYLNGLVSSYPTAYTFSDTYNVPASGAYTDPNGIMKYTVGAGGAIRIGSGIGPYLAINVALQAPTVSGSGVWINPQQVENTASAAPFTSGISPGEFITIYGSNLAASTKIASDFPLPQNLNNVQVSINGTAAPIYYVSSGQISCIVPYEVSNSQIASISVNNNGTVSNTVSMFVNPTTPGVFTQSSNGIGAGSIQHAADYSLVTSSSPAQPGETVVVYLSGMGGVNQSVQDGGSAPAGTQPTNTVAADLNGVTATASAYLTTAGLYQINLTIPTGLTAGNNVLDVATCPSTVTAADCLLNPQSYTSEAVIPVGSGGATTSATPAARIAHRPAVTFWSPARRRTPSVCTNGARVCPGRE